MQILIDPSFDMASSLPNVTGITSSTNKFIHHVGSQIFGYFDLTRKKININMTCSFEMKLANFEVFSLYC